MVPGGPLRVALLRFNKPWFKPLLVCGFILLLTASNRVGNKWCCHFCKKNSSSVPLFRYTKHSNQTYHPERASGEVISCTKLVLQPDKQCLRLLEVKREERAGLGHQVTEILFSLRLGSHLRLTPYIIPFESVKSNHGEDYTSMNDLLGLHALSNKEILKEYANYSLLREVVIKDVLPGDCGIVVKADANSCHQVNCFHSPTMSLLFQHLAPCMRHVADEYGSWSRRNPFPSSDTFNVVWHVRVGDIELHRPGDHFYTNVYAGIREALEQFSQVEHTFFGAWHHLSEEELNEYNSFFLDTFPNAALANATTEETLLHMMHCDLLVGSGSSLPLVAVLFSQKPLYINSESQKPGHHGWGFLPDYFNDGLTADLSGTIQQHPSEVRATFSRKNLASKLKQTSR